MTLNGDGKAQPFGRARSNMALSGFSDDTALFPAKGESTAALWAPIGNTLPTVFTQLEISSLR